MTRFFAFGLFVFGSLSAQSLQILDGTIVGARVSGPLKGSVPVMLTGQSFRISVDAKEQTPRDLRVHIVHCDRDWVPTRSEFVNDPFLMTGKKPLASSPAPSGIAAYARTYSASVPAGAGLEPFRFSGNYIVTIFDDGGKTDLVRFRFHVAEAGLAKQLSLRRRRLPMKISPWNEALEVSLTIEESFFASADDPVFFQLVKVMDVYKNREWETPYRVDVDNLTPSTWVEGLGTSTMRLVAGDVMPGNEYRTIDIRSADVYPRGTLLRSRDGADVSRFFAQDQPSDQNGGSTIVAAKEYTEYEQFEFQLWWEADDLGDAVYVLGEFGGWARRPEWKMSHEGSDGRYTLRTLLKRGKYDYAYSVGPDLIALEGNSWETVNLYTALVYYYDARLGGYDRILIVSQAEGNGTQKPRKGSQK